MAVILYRATARPADAMPTVDLITNDADRLAQAAVHVLQAIQLVGQVAPGVLQSLDLGITAALSHGLGPQNPPAEPSENGSVRPPIADFATYSARWAGRTCHLGETRTFMLLERLARRPNQLIPREVLLKDVWDKYTSPDALRSTVKILRRKLRAAGMEDLAEAIDGSTSRHYGLMLGRLS
jgi:DNA-binding response OmpR family regulator